MPQMAPMNWLTLYFLFLMIFLIFTVMNYFNFFYSPMKKEQKMKSIKLNWKW